MLASRWPRPGSWPSFMGSPSAFPIVPPLPPFYTNFQIHFESLNLWGSWWYKFYWWLIFKFLLCSHDCVLVESGPWEQMIDSLLSASIIFISSVTPEPLEWQAGLYLFDTEKGEEQTAQGPQNVLSENKMVIHFQQGLGLALFWYRNACKASRSYLFYPMLSGNLPIRNLERESFTEIPNSFLLEIMNTWFEGVNLLSVPALLLSCFCSIF